MYFVTECYFDFFWMSIYSKIYSEVKRRLVCLIRCLKNCVLCRAVNKSRRGESLMKQCQWHPSCQEALQSPFWQGLCPGLTWSACSFLTPFHWPLLSLLCIQLTRWLPSAWRRWSSTFPVTTFWTKTWGPSRTLYACCFWVQAGSSGMR